MAWRPPLDLAPTVCSCVACEAVVRVRFTPGRVSETTCPSCNGRLVLGPDGQPVEDEWEGAPDGSAGKAKEAAPHLQDPGA